MPLRREFEDQLRLRLARVAHGVGVPGSAPTIPPSAAMRTSTGQVVYIPPFTHAGPLSTDPSGPFQSEEDWRLSKVVVLLGVSGATDTVLTLYKNGVALGTTVTVAGAAARGSATFSEDFDGQTDILTMAFTLVGAGAERATVLPYAA